MNLLLVGLPYAAIVVFFAGLIWRYRSPFTISSLSSQIMESRWLVWGSVPFHLGIALLFFGHLAPLVAPRPWQRLVSNRPVLLAVESIGTAAAILTLVGLIVLFVRRVTSPALRAGSTAADLVVLALLIAQVALGIGVATMYRWGAVWSVATTTPYLWSVFTLRPDPALVAALPPLMLFHLVTAWIVLALIPFTRLVHMLAPPLAYLARPPQKVVWSTSNEMGPDLRSSAKTMDETGPDLRSSRRGRSGTKWGHTFARRAGSVNSPRRSAIFHSEEVSGAIRLRR